MKLALIIFAIVGVAVAGPVKQPSFKRIFLDLHSKDQSVRNTALEQVILDLLESVRGIMQTGTEDIPVLDPLQIQNIGLDGAIIDLPGSHIELNALTVSHLSTFEIENLSFTMTSLLQQRYTLTFDGSIPTVDINANNYDLSLSALGFSVFGNGEASWTGAVKAPSRVSVLCSLAYAGSGVFLGKSMIAQFGGKRRKISISLVRPRLSGTVVVILRLIGGFAITVETVDLRLQLGAFESNIRGLFGDEGASDFVNMFLGHLLPDLVQFYEIYDTFFLEEDVYQDQKDMEELTSTYIKCGKKTEISSFLNETVLAVANEILSNIDLAGIMG